MGQASSSAKSNVQVRFIVQFDGKTVADAVLPYGASKKVDLPLTDTLRITFQVMVIGKFADSIAAFGAPRVSGV